MKRKCKHPPCTYKVYRARARYTRVMKALSMLKDAEIGRIWNQEGEDGTGD